MIRCDLVINFITLTTHISYHHTTQSNTLTIRFLSEISSLTFLSFFPLVNHAFVIVRATKKKEPKNQHAPWEITFSSIDTSAVSKIVPVSIILDQPWLHNTDGESVRVSLRKQDQYENEVRSRARKFGAAS